MRPSRLLLGALAASQVAYAYLPERRRPPATVGILGLLGATALAGAVESRGRRGAALVAIAGGIAWVTEVVGVRTGVPFGRYRYGRALGPGAAGVPFLVAVPWAAMARPAWAAAGHLTRRPVLRPATAAAALAAWDVFVDPRMVRDGYWTWERGGAYAGIPASNFAGWFVTALGIFTVWSAIDRGTHADNDALALYVWTWAGETYAHAAIWHDPVVAAAGGLAMGAIAVPATARRLLAARAGR